MDDKNKQNEDSAMWFKARQENTQASYETYLSHFPQGIFRESALTALDKALIAAEDECWEMAMLEETPESIENYLSQYPQGRYVDKAQNQRLEIEKNDTELAFWEACHKEGSMKAYQNYLEKFPKGKHSNQAIQLKQQLERKEEGEGWKKATQKDSIEAYEGFINNFPKGFYQKEAKKALAARKKIAQLKTAFFEAYADEKPNMFKDIETLLVEFPDDFAVYDFHKEAKEALQESSENIAQKVEVEVGMLTEKVPASKMPTSWVLIAILAIVVLGLLSALVFM